MEYFEPLIEQAQAVSLLKSAIARNRIAPAYLFAGASGIGKSTAARCFISALFCHYASDANRTLILKRLRDGNHPDVLWVEPTYQHQGKLLSAKEAAEAGVKRKAPPQIRLEQVRDIARYLSRKPLEAPRSIIVVEQADTMAESAANGLLKTLEEPGQATIILLATSESALLPTIVSRCAKIPFYRLSRDAMKQILQQQGHGEIIHQPQILALAQGSPGSAIAAWQQFQAMPEALRDRLHKLPKSPREALELAKEIDRDLEAEAQLWLVDYLQHSAWHKHHQPFALQQLEKARQALLTYVNPRLVWECTFLSLTQV